MLTLQKRMRLSTWWYWFLTELLLAARLSGWRHGAIAALAITVIHAVHVGVHAGNPRALAIQVRLAYCGVLVVGSWPPLTFFHAMLFIGTMASLLFDYCPMARILSLAPWNRETKMSVALLRATFLSPPCSFRPMQAGQSFPGGPSTLTASVRKCAPFPRS